MIYVIYARKQHEVPGRLQKKIGRPKILARDHFVGVEKLAIRVIVERARNLIDGERRQGVVVVNKADPKCVAARDARIGSSGDAPIFAVPNDYNARVALMPRKPSASSSI